jgi:hypothetical protein
MGIECSGSGALHGCLSQIKWRLATFQEHSPPQSGGLWRSHQNGVNKRALLDDLRSLNNFVVTHTSTRILRRKGSSWTPPTC